MKGSSKRRAAGLATRQEWTARLNRFIEAKTPEEKRAVFEHAQQINPGGTIRSMLEAWGYSASGRGRKPKGTSAADKDVKPARERLEEALADLYGSESNPVKSLYPKLAGKTFATVRDAERIVAALLWAWPEPLRRDLRGMMEDRRRKARPVAVEFVRALLAELSEGRSWDWKSSDIDLYAFRLADEERIGASQFVKEASEREGALIVASAKHVLVGKNPIEAIRDFRKLTSHFIDEGSKALLIFVFNTGIFDPGDEKYDLLFNLGHLTTAMTAFALFQEELEERQTVRLYTVDWSRWQRLAARCCVVVRRPPLIDPSSGELLTRESFDDFISTWQPARQFESLEHIEPIRSFGGRHILPRAYPAELSGDDMLSRRDFYWDVTVRPCDEAREGLKVEYFIPHAQPATATHAPNGADAEAGQVVQELGGRGRRPAQTRPIEGETFYVIRKESPGEAYDDAQRTIYRATRGRLHLDTGREHDGNLLAAAALREAGYEVLPIAVAMSLLPRSLYYAYAAAGSQQGPEKSVN
jgi:hypothetical protein